jgi:tripartite-type tricarboxylate transporter receptor subunit TctC
MAKLSRRRFLNLATCAAVLPAVSHVAKAQSYPSRPITMVVPFAAGGPTDTIARILADGMRSALAQPLIIENIAGASGSTGVGRAARAAADGHTLSLGNWPTHVVNGAIYTLTYDLLKDFEPISLLTTSPLLIVAKKSIPAQDLKAFVSWLKANQDKASQGTAGPGSVAHVAGVYFQKQTDTRFQFVPYRGLGPAMQDLVSGQIDLMIDQPANSLPQVRAGTIQVYAVTASSRLPAAPDIPTVAEAGLPTFEVSSWHALWAPKGTPREIIAKLNAAVTNALSDSNLRMRLNDLGQAVFPRDQQNAEALGAFHKAEIEKWWPIIKAANIKPE